MADKPQPATYDQGPLAGKPVAGMVQQGNIDVNHRPSITNADGSHSSIFSITVPIGEDGRALPWGDKKIAAYALVPSIANGKFLTPDGKKPNEKDKKAMGELEDAATSYYNKTRQHLGVFSSDKAADTYAGATHAYMNDGSDKKVFSPSTPSAPVETPKPVPKDSPSSYLNSLPAPLRRVVESTGLKIVNGKPAYSNRGKPAIAEVDSDEPNTVDIDDPKRFSQSRVAALQTLAHEATHVWRNNLPPELQKRAPKDDPKEPYNFGGSENLQKLRAQGKTLLDLAPEQAASVNQYYVSQGGEDAPDDIKKIYKPWADDMESTPLSTIDPSSKDGMNTTARPPEARPETYYADNLYQPGSAPDQNNPLGFASAGASAPLPVSAPTQDTNPLGFESAQANPVPAAPISTGPSASNPLGFESASTQESTAKPPVSGDWYSKALSVANTPLLGEHLGDALTRQGAGPIEGGIEKGVGNLISGFTSPLSLGLTLATFGTGGLIESAGASALKEAGLALPEIEKMATAAKAADEALRVTGQPVSKAVEATGVKYADFRDAMNTLHDQGLKESDLYGGNFLERGISKTLRGTGIDAGNAQKVAKGAQFLMNSGFTAQQLDTAIKTTPRALDALRDGDYGQAAQLLTGGIASGVLGALGASHALESAGEFADPILGQKLRPSDESQKITHLIDLRDGAHETANKTAQDFENSVYKALGYKQLNKNLIFTKAEQETQNSKLSQMGAAIELGGGADDPEIVKERAAQAHNILAQAAGRDERLPASGNDVLDLPYNIHDLVENSSLAGKPKEYIDHLLDTYKGIHEGFSPEEDAAIKSLRGFDADTYELSNKAGVVSSFIENHLHRIWNRSEDNATATKISQEGRTGNFNTNVSMARHRVYGSRLEGLLRGDELANENPIATVAQDRADTQKVIANRDLLDNIRGKFVRASDGRPVVVLEGSGRAVEGSNGEDPVSLVNPRNVREIRIAKNLVTQLEQTGEFQRFLDRGDITEHTDKDGNTFHAWSPQDYVTLDNPATRGWNFAVQDTAGNPILVKSNIRIHPEYVDYFKNRLGLDESPLRKWSYTKAALKGTAAAKNVLLSFSPFHANQLMLRSLMLGRNPLAPLARAFRNDPIENSPTLTRMVNNNLTLTPDYHALQESMEGVAENSKLLEKLPLGVGRSLSWFHDLLFRRLMPQLKADAAESMYQKYSAAHPDWTQDAVAKAASRHVNDAFGGQNWRALGRSAVTQDWFRLLSLAPDWLESELRFTGRMFDKNDSLARNQLARQALGLWGTARVMNMLSTGKMHNEAPFGIVHKDQDGTEKVYSVRTLPTDILHLASDPVGFIKGRFSPLIRAGVEGITNRDQFGRKLSPGEAWVDVVKNNLPIPAQALGNSINNLNPSNTNVDQLVKAAGGTEELYRTEAEKKAAQLASVHSEEGEVDPDQLRKHQALMRIENDLRTGKMGVQDLNTMYRNGDLSQKDAISITKNVKHTQGMDAQTSRLYTQAGRLPMKDFMDVWDAATPKEQMTLMPLMQEKRRNYLKNTVHSLTPQERKADPTLLRLQSLFPQEPIF